MGKLQGAEQSHSPATSVKCDRLCGSVVGPTRSCRSEKGTAAKAVGTGSVLPCEEGSDPKRSASVPPQVGGQVQQRHLQITFYSAEQEADLDVFVPTPTPESHSLLEVYALQNKWCTRSLDIVAAFLIGRDRGASEGKPVYVRAPVEWHDLFEEWLSSYQQEKRRSTKTVSRKCTSDSTAICMVAGPQDLCTEMNLRQSSVRRLILSGISSSVGSRTHACFVV